MRSFARLMRLFGESKCILKAKTVHAKAIVSGLASDIITSNHLISMYAKLRRLHDARHVLDQMPNRNLVSWTALIVGYSNAGLAHDAIAAFGLLLSEGLHPNFFTYVGAISACASIEAAATGGAIHGRMYRVEHDPNNFVHNSLINLYAKCDMLDVAQRVFDGIRCPDLVSWASMLSGCCRCGESKKALRIFVQLRRAGVNGNGFTSASVLGACADLVELGTGRQIHCHVVKLGVEWDQYVETGIVNLYAKCGQVDEARRAFDESKEQTVPLWTALIGGYAQLADGVTGISLFHTLHSRGLKPSEHTFSSTLAACTNVFGIKEGRQLHCVVLKSGFKVFIFVANAIIDLYAKCRLLEESIKVFDEIEERDLVSWNALIAGHVQMGCFIAAVDILDEMLLEGLCPNIYTYSCILSLCGDLPAIQWGKQTHGCITKHGLDEDVYVGSALIDMYAKCGRLDHARYVFNHLHVKNIVSWNSILVGYAQHGFGLEALKIFSEMNRDGVKPSDVTFLGVLSACVHVGLVEDGQRYFDSMMRDHGIIPRIDHYTCMVDLFARGGEIRRAYEFIRSMPVEPDKVIWRALLSGCKSNKELALGRYAAECIFRADPEDASAYVMLSSIYAKVGMWKEAALVRKEMKEKGLKKDPGCSWIEVRGMVHSFIARDIAHIDRDIVFDTVNELTMQMFDDGYEPSAGSFYDEEYN